MTPILVATVIATTPIVDLEKAFWDCDYGSTKTLAGAGDAASCSIVFESLKARKFDNDFTKMMEWWKANKEQEHRRRS